MTLATFGYQPTGAVTTKKKRCYPAQSWKGPRGIPPVPTFQRRSSGAADSRAGIKMKRLLTTTDCFEVSSDQPECCGFKPGDTVIVDWSQRPADGEVGAVSTPDGVQIVRIRADMNGAIVGKILRPASVLSGRLQHMMGGIIAAPWAIFAHDAARFFTE